MKLTLLYLLAVVVLAGVIGTLAARDPGYVLISYNGATLQTGLWVFLGLLFLLGFGIWLLQRVWRGFFAGAARIQQWRKDRSLKQSIEHTSRGLIYLQEGNASRAEKFLNSGIKHQPLPAVNYLHLARAANDQNKAEEREKYLRLAVEADSGVTAAVRLLRAELAFARQDWQTCLSALQDAPDTDRTLLYKKSALVGLGNWRALGELLPRLKKAQNREMYLSLEKQYLLATFADSALQDEQKLKVYRGADSDNRQDSAVLLALKGHLSAEKELEAIFRKLLKGSWQPPLVEAYAELGTETLPRRLKTALSWQGQHPVDPALNYCIGYLHEQQGSVQQARDAYEAAIAQGGHGRASQQLAKLHAAEGNFKQSVEVAQLGPPV